MRIKRNTRVIRVDVKSIKQLQSVFPILPYESMTRYFERLADRLCNVQTIAIKQFDINGGMQNGRNNK